MISNNIIIMIINEFIIIIKLNECPVELKKLTFKGKNNYNRSTIRKMLKLCTMSVDKN